MKALRAIVLITGLFQAESLSAGGFDQVMAGPHNLAASGPGTVREDVCLVCHMERIEEKPSNAPPLQQPHALWDTGNDVQNFMPSAQTSLIQGAASYNQRHAACTDCHDGILGKDFQGFAGGGPASMAMTTAHSVNRSSNHPTNILYPRQPDGRAIGERPDPKLKRYWSIPDRNENGLVLPTGPVSTRLGLKDIDPNDPNQAAGLVHTVSGFIKCETCHDPHNNDTRPFLRVPHKTLCLVCHDR